MPRWWNWQTRTLEGRMVKTVRVQVPPSASNLIEAAKEASKKAYAPYSNNKVGASVLTENNKIYTGSNIENASYSLTICAERTAIFNAVLDGQRKIDILVVYDEKTIYPCGACLQVLSEFSDNPLIILADKKGVVFYRLKDLLPKPFTHFSKT